MRLLREEKNALGKKKKKGKNTALRAFNYKIVMLRGKKKRTAWFFTLGRRKGEKLTKREADFSAVHA